MSSANQNVAKGTCPKRSLISGMGLYFALPPYAVSRQMTASPLQLYEWEMMRKKKEVENASAAQGSLVEATSFIQKAEEYTSLKVMLTVLKDTMPTLKARSEVLRTTLDGATVTVIGDDLSVDAYKTILTSLQTTAAEAYDAAAQKMDTLGAKEYSTSPLQKTGGAPMTNEEVQTVWNINIESTTPGTDVAEGLRQEAEEFNELVEADIDTIERGVEKLEELSEEEKAAKAAGQDLLATTPGLQERFGTSLDGIGKTELLGRLKSIHDVKGDAKILGSVGAVSAELAKFNLPAYDFATYGKPVEKVTKADIVAQFKVNNADKFSKIKESGGSPKPGPAPQPEPAPQSVEVVSGMAHDELLESLPERATAQSVKVEDSVDVRKHITANILNGGAMKDEGGSGKVAATQGQAEKGTGGE